MLRTLFTSLLLFSFIACTQTSSLVVNEQQQTETLDKTSIYKIAIPVREQGYSNFDTQVLSSKLALDAFVKSIKKQKNWNQKENFLSSLTLYPIDFTKYNLLLYRMTENSGSTVLAVDVPKGNAKHVLIEIGRDKPEVGTADMAYYALAYKVAKSVQDISFDNGLKKHVIKNKTLSVNNQNDEIPEGCLAWYDGCNNCFYLKDSKEVACTKRYCIWKGEFKCTKWKK